MFLQIFPFIYSFFNFWTYFGCHWKVVYFCAHVTVTKVLWWSRIFCGHVIIKLVAPPTHCKQAPVKLTTCHSTPLQLQQQTGCWDTVFVIYCASNCMRFNGVLMNNKWRVIKMSSLCNNDKTAIGRSLRVWWYHVLFLHYTPMFAMPSGKSGGEGVWGCRVIQQLASFLLEPDELRRNRLESLTFCCTEFPGKRRVTLAYTG